MARTIRSHVSLRLRQVSFVLVLLLFIQHQAQAQTATYHLHGEASSTANHFQLKTAAPDAVSVALQSAELRSLAAGEYVLKEFDTQAGVPNSAGTIPTGSNISFTVWMKKTAAFGTLFPRVKLRVNNSSGVSLCTATGTSALTTTLTKYTLSCTTTATVLMTAADRFYLWAGINMTVGSTNRFKAELDIEGTLNGNYDSLVVVPLAIAPPSISALTPNVGPVGTSVTVSGANFGASQGTSTVTFNGITAAPTGWSNTSIVAPVPAGATTGNVIVTVGGTSSNGVVFNVGNTGTLAGTITRASDATGLNYALVEALQSGVVKASTRSALDGTYSLNLLAGNYDVRASATRFAAQTQSALAVAEQSSTSANFALVEGEPIRQIYDELGRLVSVVDPSGDTVTYTYDVVGNLLSIARRSSAQVSVIEFIPNKGVSGTPVTIYGTGFSSTPAQNTVKFNGVTATVVSSNSTEIVANVPAGATTGTINVTTPNGTATSSAPFTIGSDGPIVTSFTPTIGAAATAVNITGSNFETTASGNRVAFNGKRSIVTSATATSIATSVPSGATSGRIAVTTYAGKGVSGAYFFVPPASYTAADVEVAGQMALGESKVVTIATANKIGMILFEGTAGQRASLRLTSSSISSGSVNIYKPDGTSLGSTGISTSGGYIDTKTLPLDGTYTILVDPQGTATGSLTLNLYNIVDATGTITPGGSAVATTTTMPGQNTRLTFNGTTGQRISVNGSINFGGCWTLAMLKPDGAQLTSTFSCGSSIFIEPQSLPTSGVYTILVDASDANVGQSTVSLYDVVDVTGTINTNGVSASLTITTPGQNGHLTFNGTAGQRVSVNSSSTFNGCWTLAVLNPDGSQLSSIFSCGSSIFQEPLILPAAGTYTILLNPSGAAIGQGTAALYDVSDVTGTTTIGGAATSVAITTPGQNGRLTFDGTAGQRVSVNSTSTMNGCWTLAILKPDGTQLTSVFSCGSSIFLEPQSLTESGVYTLLIDPSGAVTGQANVTLYDVVDVTGTISIGGAATSVSIPTPGQNGRLTFEGTAGQRVSVNSTSTMNGCWTLAVLNPDGSQLTSIFSCGSSIFLEPQLLAATGTYTLLFNPSGAVTGQATATLYEVVDFAGTTTVGGGSTAVAITTPGQNGRLTFNATAGQRVSVNSTSTMNGCWTLAILKPDGTQLTSVFSCGSSIFLEPQTIPTTGTYTVLIDPSGAVTGQASPAVYEVVDVTGTVAIGGAAVNVSTTVPGQNGRLTFDGTAGQQVTVRTTGGTMGCVRVSLLKPDNTSQTSVFSCGSNFNLATQTLSTTGTYAVTIDPSGANTGSINISVTNP